MKWMLAVAAFAGLFVLPFRREGREPKEFIEYALEATAEDTVDPQLEDLWVAEVIERSADRTSDEMSGLDSMVTGLLAVQAAIYAILIDKLAEFGSLIPTLFIIAIVIAAVNLFVLRARKVPNLETFYEEAMRDTQQTRKDLIAAQLIATKKNESRLWLKRVLFWVALGLTVLAAMLAPSQAHPHTVAPPLYRVLQSRL